MLGFLSHQVFVHVIVASFEANALQSDVREIEEPCIATNEQKIQEQD